MNFVEYKDNKNIKKDIKPLYLSAFPVDERPPANYYFRSFKNPNNHLYAFYDDDLFVGFSSITIYKDICYIFFLAVSPELRGQGYGSKILSELKNIYSDYVLLLCYEEVDKKYEDYEYRCKRETFYQKNGFVDNELKTNEFGVIFQTVYIGKHKVSFSDYQNIFANGFGEFAIKFLKEEK